LVLSQEEKGRKNGVLECLSSGVLVWRLRQTGSSGLSYPHYSITPLLHYLSLRLIATSGHVRGLSYFVQARQPV